MLKGSCKRALLIIIVIMVALGMALPFIGGLWK